MQSIASLMTADTSYDVGNIDDIDNDDYDDYDDDDIDQQVNVANSESSHTISELTVLMDETFNNHSSPSGM